MSEGAAEIRCAQNHGYCCKNSKITQATTDICKKDGGIFYHLLQNAKKYCRGYCNYDKKTQRMTRRQCQRVKGEFFETSVLARKNLIKVKQQSVVQKSSFSRPGRQLRNALPDLVVKSVSWSSNPVEGQLLGHTSILNITVNNKGPGSASPSKLHIGCKSLTGTNCPSSLVGEIDVPGLITGESMSFAWPSPTDQKWLEGTYRMTFTADYQFNMVAESNENNNTKILTFTVPSSMELLKKLQVKPVSNLKIMADMDLEVVSITISNNNPFPQEEVTVTAIVQNTGKLKTPSVYSKFTFWNTNGGGPGSTFYTVSPSVPSLFPGQTFKLETTTTLITLAGHVGVVAEIDPQNYLEELNENNNKKTLYFDVICKSELASYDYTKPKPANIQGLAKIGEDFQLDVWVYNNGGCASEPAVLAIQGVGVSLVTYTIPAISRNSKVKIPVTLRWETSGIKDCEIIVDYTDVNSESIENNNRMPLIVTVVGDWPNTE